MKTQKIDSGSFANGERYDVDGFLAALRGAVKSSERVDILGTPRVGFAGGRYNPDMMDIREKARRSGTVIVWTT